MSALYTLRVSRIRIYKHARREAEMINMLIIRVHWHELWQVQLFSQFMNESGTKIFTGKLLSFSHIELTKINVQNIG